MEQYHGWKLLWLVYFGGVLFAITRPTVKILEQLPNKLAFRIRPTFFWGIEVFFAGIGLLLLLFTLTFTPVTTLTCNRTAPLQLSPITLQDAPASAMCELVRINWFGGEKSKTFISGLQGATEETKIKKDDNGITTSVYRVVLHTNRDNVPFTEKYTAYDNENRQTLISQINTFVENPLQASLTVQEDDRLIGYGVFGIAGFFILVSLVIIAVIPAITYTFDKNINSVIVKQQSWFRAQVSQHSLNEILNAQVEYNSSDQGLAFRVALSLISGKSLPLTSYYTSGSEEKKYLAALITSFLNSSDSSQPVSEAK
ncbi:MAG: hypothetical protein ACRCZS_25065 [Chroococcidiopsis sp.]